MKTLLSILLYASLIFLIGFLYYFDYIEVPVVRHPWLFFAAAVLVWVGYLLDSKAWHIVLRSNIPEASFRDAFVSSGSYILTKYIPGKLWVIIGKAGYIREKYNGSFVDLSSFSFFNLLISLTAGAMVGVGVFYMIDRTIFLITSLLMIAGLVYLFWGYQWILRFTSEILTKVLRKTVQLPSVPRGVTLKMILVSLLIWVVWSLGFYLMLVSLEGSSPVPLLSGLIFPVSAIFGVAVVFAPGGLGFREGLIALGLAAMGLSPAEAASFAVISRLWFLAGEVLFFCSAWAMRIRG